MIRRSPYWLSWATLCVLTFLSTDVTIGQLSFTQQAGGFGPVVGRIASTLGQVPASGQPSTSVTDHQGWELGLKSEIYRTQWLRGNLMASYVELGAREWVPSESSFRPVDINLRGVKAALNPILFKVGSDFLHGYAGGGIYGTFLFNQEVESETPVDNYWQTEELKEIDFGLDLTAGIHIWSFDIEFHAQYGAQDIGQRLDGTGVRQEFYGISIAYLYVNQNVIRKSCKDKKALKNYKKYR